jgi:hypothetical protein
MTEAWIDSVYRCATGDVPWEVALRPIVQETQTFCIGALNHTIMPLTASIIINVDGPTDLASSYEQTFVNQNPLIDALSSLTPGNFITG